MKKLLLGAMVLAGVGAFAYWMLSDRKDEKEEAYSEVELSEIEKLKHELKIQKKKNKNLQKEFDDQTNKIKELYGGEENEDGETPLLFRVSDDDSDEDDIDKDLDRLYNESSDDDDDDDEDEREVVFGISEDSEEDSYYPMNFKEAIEKLDNELTYVKDIDGIDDDIFNLIIATHDIAVCLLYSYLVECNDTIRANRNVLERYMSYLEDCLDEDIFEPVNAAYNDVKIFVEAYLEETDENYVGFLQLKEIFGSKETASDNERDKKRRQDKRKKREEKKEHVNKHEDTDTESEATTEELEEALEENDEGKGSVEPEEEPVIEVIETEEGDEDDE